MMKILKHTLSKKLPQGKLNTCLGILCPPFAHALLNAPWKPFTINVTSHQRDHKINFRKSCTSPAFKHVVTALKSKIGTYDDSLSQCRSILS